METKNYYNATFYDISEDLNKEYSKTGYITPEMNKDLEKRINEYIYKYNYKSGDILFVGSTYQTRQEYGFYLVLDGKCISSESIFDCILNDKILVKIKQNNIKYEQLLLQVNLEYIWVHEMFMDMCQDYDYIEKFREENIY